MSCTLQKAVFPEKHKKMQQAALILQRTWRLHWRFARTSMLVKTLTRKVNSEQAKSITFNALVEILKDKQVIRKMHQVIARLVPCAMARHHNLDPRWMTQGINVKILLSAFLMVHKSKHVFGDTEEPVQQAAVEFLAKFEEVATSLVQNGAWVKVPASVSADLLPRLSSFLDKFHTWKQVDSTKLKQVIKTTLTTMYQTREVLVATDQSKLPEVEAEIERLREKLVVLGGPQELVRVDADEERRLQKSPMEDYVDDIMMSVMSKQQLKRLNNAQIMHEVLMEGTAFTLLQVGDEAQSDAYWTAVVEELVQNNCFDKILKCLMEFRRGILCMAASCPCCIEKYKEIERIETKIRTENALSWDDAKFVLEKMLALLSVQPPAEWEEQGLEHFVKMLRMCCEDLADRRIAAANERIRTVIMPIAPVYGITYERAKFEERLAIEKTVQWLQDAVTEKGPAGGHLAIHAHAIVMLIAQKDRPLPETLELDAERIAKMRNYFQEFVQSNIALMMPSGSKKLCEAMMEPTSEVYKHLSARFFQVLVQRLLTEDDERPVRIMPKALPVAMQNGVRDFIQEVRKMAKLNRQVYMEHHYAVMLHRIISVGGSV